jgi:hypothetical protein
MLSKPYENQRIAYSEPEEELVMKRAYGNITLTALAASDQNRLYIEQIRSQVPLSLDEPRPMRCSVALSQSTGYQDETMV